MRKLESNIVVDNEPFQDIVRYENESIYNTMILNCNVGSPIFFGCTLKEMVFDTCDLNNARFFSDCTIEECKFNHCDLRSIGIEENKAVFTDCEFIGCDMRGMTLENATFIRCQFKKCKLNNRILKEARIVDCCFVGKLIDITFEGEGKQKWIVNFEECILDDVHFINCNLIACIPPKFKDHLYVDDLSVRIKSALTIANKNFDLSVDERKRLVRSLNKLQNNQQYIFNITNMKKNYGDMFTVVFLNSLGLEQ